MILYIFNNYFPDSSGFGKRCFKEIEILSAENDITVICRKNPGEKKLDQLKIGSKLINIIKYDVRSNVMERTGKSYISVLYELTRNLNLVLGLSKAILNFLWKNRNQKNIKVYSVVSPLTVPLLAFMFAKAFRASPHVIEFHDLEPELAMHIKGLKRESAVVKIEFWLEKLLCKSFKKIIVTNDTQAKRIAYRTGINLNKILVIPNSLQVEENIVVVGDIRKKYGFDKSDFIVGYVSNFSYNYTIAGVIQLFNYIGKNNIDLKNIKFLLVGDGDGLKLIKESIKKNNLHKNAMLIGRVKNVSEVISIFDVGMIPWVKDGVSETILPTKLFEYMQARKYTIAPEFGEFEITQSKFNILHMYDTIEGLVARILNAKSKKNFLKTSGSRANAIYDRYFKAFHFYQALKNL